MTASQYLSAAAWTMGIGAVIITALTIFAIIVVAMA